ncbi:MAG: DUF99 family protein [Candidatus Aenigmarchaeota archaeon]|nr:DUF99 family protein [Candidatus Aenigmarchaeota archaeon]
MLRTIKPEIRIIGWDDSPFNFDDKETFLVGVVCRGGTQVDGLMSVKIRVDGLDVTEKIIQSIKNSTHIYQLRLIMLDGITFGGFNIADINEIRKETGLPVLVVIRDMPKMEAIRKSLERLDDSEKRWVLIKRAGPVHAVKVENKTIKRTRNVYYQCSGLSEKAAEKVIKLTSTHSIIPEPVRLAHIIASGLKGLRPCE